MKSFSDLNIDTHRLTGRKIFIEDVVDIPIEVLDFKIDPSRYPEKGNGKRLTIQIRHENNERVIFTGSVILQEQCLKAKELDGFPFKAKIIALKPRGFKFT